MSGSGIEAQMLIGDRYVLQSPIGHGGMGEVWRAQHVALNSFVAIKFLKHAGASEVSTRKRFLKEAQVTARLKTRHAVSVFDFGFTEQGLPYIVMELLEGETLGRRIARAARLGPATTVRFLRQTARALDRAHAMGIVHRDLKPDNIVVVKDEEGREEVKVLDFGIAKLVGELEEKKEELPAAIADKAPMSTFTRTGGLVGTPSYMAPEQILGEQTLGPPADIWALGVVTFECLTGSLPFSAENVPKLFQNILKNVHPKASSIAPELPPELDDWFDKACARGPQYRFETAKGAMTALAQALRIDDRTTQEPTEAADVSGSRAAFEAAPTLDVQSDSGRSAPVTRDSSRRPFSSSSQGPDTLSVPERSVPRPQSRRVLPLVMVVALGGAVFATVSLVGRAPHATLMGNAATAPPTAAPSAAPSPVPSSPDLAVATAEPAPSVAARAPEPTASSPRASASIRPVKPSPPKSTPAEHHDDVAAASSPPPATTPPPQRTTEPMAPPAPSAFVLPPTGL